MVGTALEVKNPPADAWSVWDAQLVKTAARAGGQISPEELAKECGSTPARCASRLRELLGNRDWLTVIEQQSLIMEDMARLRTHLFDMVEGGEWYDDNGKAHGAGDPRWSAELLKTLRAMADMTAIKSQQIREARVVIRGQHADLLVAALERGFDLLLKEIEAEHPEVDADEYRERLVHEILPTAAEQIEAARAS